jgi:hypothetical protein
MADEVRITVSASQFEVPILGRQPGVEHFRNCDAMVTQNQHARRLLAAMAGVALDVQTEQALFRHKFNHRTVTLLGGMGITVRSLKGSVKDTEAPDD